MVERAKRGKHKHKRQERLLGNHARCWIWGRNLVAATLECGRWPIVELHLADSLPAVRLAEARAAAARLGVRVHVAGRDVLERLGQTSEHQGYLAKMGPYPYATAADVLAGGGDSPLYLILDAIQDPYNFGAMLRSAGAFGAAGVFIGCSRQAPVSSMAARSSAGVVNRLPIAVVDDLVGLAHTLRGRRVTVVGASEKGGRPLTACDFRRGTAIVIGNEGTGISPELQACCDVLARIPIAGGVGSLNAAAAAAVFFFEVQRQRGAAANS